MKNLVVDYGNTFAKVGIFDHDVLVEKHSFAAGQGLEDFLEDSVYDNSIVSSVSAVTDPIIKISQRRARVFVLTSSLPLPIKNLYGTPATLGVDRIAAACGAASVSPGQNCLVIDAGTCITYEFIDGQRQYHGGAIGPGLQMRLKAVHTFTARLPLVQATAMPPLIGDSTERSIQSGVVNGMLAEIEGTIARYQKEFGVTSVILCGGDTHFFENQLKGSIFAVPDLVLVGLNSILSYNVNL